MKWASLERMISDLSNDTTFVAIDPTDPELYAFTLCKCLNAYNSGSMRPISMKWVSLESMISDLSDDTAVITIYPTDLELYAFTL